VLAETRSRDCAFAVRPIASILQYTGVGVKAIELTIIASSNFSRPRERKNSVA
jgi:hypothetical protein